MPVDILRSVSPAVKKVINLLLQSSLLACQITYHSHDSDSFDAELGHGKTEFVDYENVKAIRLRQTETSLELFGNKGGVELGDLMFFIKKEDLGVVPNSRDEITDDVKRQVLAVVPVMEFGYLITCRGV